MKISLPSLKTTVCEMFKAFTLADNMVSLLLLLISQSSQEKDAKYCTGKEEVEKQNGGRFIRNYKQQEPRGLGDVGQGESDVGPQSLVL